MRDLVTVVATVLGLMTTQAPAPSFDYDAAAPLDVRFAAARTEGAARLRDLTYASLDGARNGATLVEPIAPAAAARPAVLFVHWYGPPEPTSNRTQFMPDAVELAAAGVVSLLIDTPWSVPEYFRTRTRDTDFARSVQQVKDLRRALDVLVGQPGVDRTRIGYVGHDFGAMYGVIAAAVDARVRAFVFMAGAPSFSDWFLYGPPVPADVRQRFIDEMAPLDPSRYLSRLTVPVLIQLGDADPHVPKARAEVVAAAAPAPKDVRTYQAEHYLNPAATRDRQDWLKARLGVR